MRLPEALAPLREPNFAWYYAARFSSLTGSMMVSVALAFAVLGINDSASALGFVLAAHTVPMVVFLLFGGVLADRFDRTRVIWVTALLSALTQGTVAALVITGVAELWMVIVLEAVNGTVSAASFPAMAGMLPQLVPRGQLQQANVLFSMSRGGLAILGPTLAALLVVSLGAGWALAVDALTWLVAAALITRVRLPEREKPAESPNMLTELREGWSVFVGSTWLWVVVVAFGFLNAIHVGAWYTLGPVIAKDTIGERGWGLVLSAQSCGVLLMTLVLLRVRLRRPLLLGMLGCSLLAVPLLTLGVNPSLLPLICTALVAGMGVEVFSLGWNLAVQENVEERMLSRVYSYDALGSFVAMPIGQVVYGPLGDAFGYRRVLVVSAVVYAVIALGTLASRSVRTLDRSPAEPAEPAEV